MSVNDAETDCQLPRWDFVLRHIFARLRTFPRLFELPDVVQLMPELAIWKGFFELRPDLLAMLNKSDREWPDWLAVILLHMEFVSRYRPGEIGPRLRDYECAITLQIQGNVLIYQLVLVMGTPPPTEDSASRRVPVYLTEAGELIHRRVVYVQEQDITRLSPEDRASVAGQMLGIIMADDASDADARKLAQAIVAVPDAGERLLHARAVQALVYHIPSFATAWDRYTHGEEVATMIQLDSPRAQEDILNAFLDDPEFRDRLWKEAEKRGKAEGKKEGKEEGKKEAHVNALLAVLRERNIELPPALKAALRDLDCAVLPELHAAFTARDVDDFARLAQIMPKP